MEPAGTEFRLPLSNCNVMNENLPPIYSKKKIIEENLTEGRG